MLREQLVVEASFRRERTVDITVEIDGQQTAAVVGAERNLSAGVGAQRLETQVGIAIGDGLADDGVPEHHTRFRRLPCIVDDFVPQGPGINLLGVFRCRGINRILLNERLAFFDALHELICETHRHVGVGDAALSHLGIDESFRIGVFDADAHHQGTASTILSDFLR